MKRVSSENRMTSAGERGVSRKHNLFFAILSGIILSLPPGIAKQSVEELKPAVPSFDNTVVEESKNNKADKSPLSGGVEHNALVQPPKIPARVQKTPFSGKQRQPSLTPRHPLSGALDDGGAFLESEAKRGIGIIGVKFEAVHGYPPRVRDVFPGTPAAQVQVYPGDFIVAVDGVPTQGLTKDECYDLIVGTPNTPVTLTLRRGAQFLVRTMNRMDFLELTNARVRQAYSLHF